MDEDVKVQPLMNESQALAYIKERFTTNPKKLKKLLRSMIPLCEDYIVNGIICNTLQHSKPVPFIERCFVQIEDYKVVIKDLIEDGNHGMIMVGDVVYPVKLDTRENWLKDAWNPTDELEIQHHSCNEWMRTNNKGYFHGRVVLFECFGFSNIPREIEMKCIKDTNGLKRYPGTNFYT